MPVDYKDQKELTKYLEKVDKIFNIDELLEKKIDSQDIVEYYRESNLGYKFLHSVDGSIHMAINYDGEFDKEGYLGQAEIVQKYINITGAKRILELASGNGFNSTLLAKNNPEVEFIGIDLTPEHIKYSKEHAEGLPNLRFQQGNFQNLDFKDNSFDLVFEIESICHATDMAKVLSETYRVLKSSAHFIVIDGFRSQNFDTFSDELKTAGKLVELSMAVGNPWKVKEWLSLCEEIGFTLENLDDLSYAIMPNLLKFQFLARGFFKFPSLSRLLLIALPKYLVQNAIAGIFMPFTIGAEMQLYLNIVLTKE